MTETLLRGALELERARFGLLECHVLDFQIVSSTIYLAPHLTAEVEEFPLAYG